ncbi:MAG: RICIN domain-containing protein, partial [Alloprevotella sp.]|nr:RICIN domain-containing protein [Prevotellamassilia sp.]MDY5762217.1 RICIN domain-containing protein [Alloprevotella sp.]
MKRLKLFLGLVAALFMAVTGSTYAQTHFEVSDAPTDGRWAANTKWYFLHFVNSDAYHTAGYMGTKGDAYINSNGQLLLNGTDKPLNAGGIWCFVGDAENGYKIYNRNTGTSKILSMTTDNNGVAKMLDEGTEGNTQRFDCATTTNAGAAFTGKATLKFHGSTNSYLNNSDGTPKCHVGVWSDDQALGAAGSVIDIIEVTDDELYNMGLKVKVSTENDKHYFMLKSKRSGKYAGFDGNNGLTQIAYFDVDAKAFWYVTQDGSGYKIHNAATEKIVDGTTMTAAGSTMYIDENKFNPGYFCISTDADNTTAGSCWDESSPISIGTWAPTASDADGTSWSIENLTTNYAK